MADSKTEDKLTAKMELAEPTSVAKRYVDDLIVDLHIKALENIKSFADFTVQNSAIEGDGKNATFYGAGSHIVAAIPKDSNKHPKIPKATAFEILKTYLLWFSGPDVANKLTIDKLVELNPDEKKNESIVPSFSLYLVLEDGEDTSSTDEETDKSDSSTEDKDKDADKDTDKKDDKDEEGKGYFVSYKILIAGLKEHPIADALKKLGKDLLKGFGVTIGSWRTPGGETHTLGGLIDDLDKIFGKIDPDLLKANFDKNLKAKLPLTSTASELFDLATIVRILKNKLDGKEKSKIKTADYSFCVKVARNDKSRKIVNVQLIADLITKSIQGIFKKFKNKISKNDVILVNDYDENDKTKDKANKNLKQDTNDESLLQTVGNIIVEDNAVLAEVSDSKKSVDDVLKEMQEYLQKEVDAKFKDANKHEAEIKSSDDIVNDIKAVAKANEKAFNIIRKHKNAFKIELETAVDETPKGESILIYHANKNLLRILFEAISDDDPNKAAIEELFSNLANKTEFLKARGKDAPEKDEIFAFNVEAVKTESIKAVKNIYDMLFEDADVRKLLDILLYEADKKKTDLKKLNKVKDLIKAKIDIIRSKYADKKDDFIKYVYSDQGLQLAWTKDKEAENNGFNKFIDEIFSDDSPEETAKKIASMTSNKNFRNDIIYRFIAPIEKLEDEQKKQETVKISLFDADPKSGEKTGDPIAEFDVPKGQAFNSTDDGKKAFEDANKQLEDNKKDSFTFKGWSKDASEKAEEDTELVAKYLADEDKDKEFTVVFQYPPDPSKEDAVEEVPGELGTLKIKAGESAEEPEPPEIDGWKFKKWSDDTSNVTDDMMVLAEYLKPARFIFKAPEDPEKPEETKQLGDPIEAEEGKAPTPPEPPKFDNYDFDKWNPDPATIKNLEGDLEIVATYKKKDGDGKKTFHAIYVLPDYAGILDEDEKETVTITFKAPKLDEKDPTKTDITKTEPIGEPLKLDKDKPIDVEEDGTLKQDDKELAKPTDLTKAGYVFDKWDPDPSKGFNKDTDVNATYKEDENKKAASKNLKGEGYDFYIVPMKGLKPKDSNDTEEKK